MLVTHGWGQRSDWFRIGRAEVPPSLSGGSWDDRYRSIRGGGLNPKTKYHLPFHFHIHRFNWYRPYTWFKIQAR